VGGGVGFASSVNDQWGDGQGFSAKKTICGTAVGYALGAGGGQGSASMYQAIPDDFPAILVGAGAVASSTIATIGVPPC